MSPQDPSAQPKYCSVNDALFAAYHEAGHVVAAGLVDPPRPVAWVRIESDAHGCGGQTHYEGEGGPLGYGMTGEAETDRAGAESDAIVTILGPLCAMWYTTGRFRQDNVLAEDVRSALDYCLLKRKDWERVQLLGVLLHGFEPELVDRWLTEMLQSSFDLLARPGFLASVAAVASALLRKGTLDGAEVEELAGG